MKKAYIKTYGCQMNEYDSERIKDILTSLQYDIIEDYKEADIVLLNTCNIREKASEKVYSELGRINLEKKRLAAYGKYMVIVVAGCVAQGEGESIFKRTNYVDIVVGPESYHNLPELIKKANNGEKDLISIEFEANEKFDKLSEERSAKVTGSSFITIQEGCDKFCTFCVVPYTRGPEYSRSPESIIEEVKKNVDLGAKEIVLLGQNVSSYHGTSNNTGLTWRMSDLIAKTCEVSGVERVRYTTSHPNDIHDDLISVHGCEKKLMPLLNLPVQSGSDRILKAMNRKYTKARYIEIIEAMRKVRPEIIFSSDFIVGFPGERDEDFEETLDLVRRVRFEGQCFSFKYSPRPGTPAEEDDNQVSEDVKSERLQRLQSMLDSDYKKFNDGMLARVVNVLFDNNNARIENQISGRSEYSQIVLTNVKDDFMKQRLIGKIGQVKITKVNNNSIFGDIIDIVN